MDKQRIACLFRKYIDKSASSEEIDELMQYIDRAPDEEVFSLMEAAYQSLQHTAEADFFSTERRSNILKAVLKTENGSDSTESDIPSTRKRSLWSTFSKIAAVLLIGLAIGGVLYKSKQESKPQSAAMNEPVDIAPGGNMATLTLANGSVIGLNDINEGEIVKQDGFIITKTDDGQISYIIDDMQEERSTTVAKELIFNTIEIPRGGKYQVALPDGTKVWLNSASSLTYPTKFSNNERKVTLTGEGYFEVAKNAKAPFTVTTEDQSITVLGTHFNVRSYGRKSATQTTLLEGSVRVNPISKTDTQNASRTLKPGEQSILNAKRRLEVKKVNASNVISWKDDLFYFEDTDIRSVMEEFSRWYNFEFEFEGKMPATKLWGKVHRNVNASEALDILSYFNLKYRIIDITAKDTSANSRKKVIISHL
ncbi:FecR family protein [Sphingobacterium gobiense]|uniref:Anti-sigma factor n=1 Tax=Sphingobacterium gobiense TaxID=1382456 RepID=A0A2S9JTP6_9SPHI|nr:FecR family protein [Sphingobacterium gobiense]PRD56644.1 hypothetical protein C5749_05265 [Sphingobacterium gobiense]